MSPSLARDCSHRKASSWTLQSFFFFFFLARNEPRIHETISRRSVGWDSMKVCHTRQQHELIGLRTNCSQFVRAKNGPAIIRDYHGGSQPTVLHWVEAQTEALLYNEIKRTIQRSASSDSLFPFCLSSLFPGEQERSRLGRNRWPVQHGKLSRIEISWLVLSDLGDGGVHKKGFRL